MQCFGSRSTLIKYAQDDWVNELPLAKINYVYGKIKYHNKKNWSSQFFIVKVDRSDDDCGYLKFLLVGFARI